MTSKNGRDGKVDKKSGTAKRNKKTDMYGEPYDKRKGTWGEYDKAIAEADEITNNWLCPERVLIELRLINENKRGPPFRYPPSMILFMLMKKEDSDGSYRKIPAECRPLLEACGIIDCDPCYKTVQRGKARFFGKDGIGDNIMVRAGEILKEMGVEEPFDPVMFVGSGVFPEYEAPQKKPVCQKDVDEQEKMDAEAERLRRNMEVFVNREHIGKEVEAAVDGSGEGTKGCGIYMEYVWSGPSKSFIKQHAAVNPRTIEVIAFSITLESPGDARVLGPMIEGMTKTGVNVSRIDADAAYDSAENWRIATDNGIDFHPNLRTNFVDDRDIPERRAQRMEEERLGKKLFHRTSGYNIRWKVEVFFSATKKLYGERVKDRLFENMVVSMKLRFMLYTIRRRCILKHLGPNGILDKCAVLG